MIITEIASCVFLIIAMYFVTPMVYADIMYYKEIFDENKFIKSFNFKEIVKDKSFDKNKLSEYYNVAVKYEATLLRDPKFQDIFYISEPFNFDQFVEDKKKLKYNKVLSKAAEIIFCYKHIHEIEVILYGIDINSNVYEYNDWHYPIFPGSNPYDYFDN